jgi:FMN phosphatase YigB (HAD superfamily)
MKLRTVIFDIYKTVLDVGPAPANQEGKWQTLVRDRFGAAPRLTLAEFATACDAIIAREHAVARAAGVPHPEIFWPDIVAEVLPELSSLPDSDQSEFLFQQQTLFRTVRLMPGAADVLRLLHNAGVPIGIASNAQPYTLHELDRSMAGAGLSLDIFTRALCFWSFEHGFSKPDPHVFRLLTARLRMSGVHAAETLMVGDRSDNDIAPAHAQGWKTWQLTSASRGQNSAGDWHGLGGFVAVRI